MNGISVVLPTFDEAGNVRELLDRLDRVLRGRIAEIVIVDDGSDDLPDLARELAPSLSLPVRVVRRDVPAGRLGGAVVEGIRLSRFEHVVIMDADLQHPPELVPELVAGLADHDVVVASRYRSGGDPGGLSNGIRKVVSRGSGALTRALFPATVAEGFRFVRQLARLRVATSRATAFALVGATGVVLLVSGPTWSPLLASVVTMAVSFAVRYLRAERPVYTRRDRAGVAQVASSLPAVAPLEESAA